MLVVRGDSFIIDNEKIYIVGSGSNRFYKLLVTVMGPYKMMAWTVDKGNYNLEHLEVFDETMGVELIINSGKTSLFNKFNLIRKVVRNADCLSFKLPLPHSIIGCLWAILYNKKYVVESGGDLLTALWYHEGIAYKLMAVPLDLIVRIEHRLAKHIIYVSKNFLQKKYLSKARQLGCSDAVIYITPESVLAKRIDKITNKRGCFRLGLIGATQAGYRGHDTLIKAASLLKDKGYDIKVSFLGGGTADDKRKKCAKKCNIGDRIEFCGRIKHDEVLSWIDNIDVLVMPTLQETLGRAVIEAMSRGCPVIGTYETALGEQIGSDCLVHARNVQEIANTIERIIKYKDYALMCARENFYRAMKYNIGLTYEFRKEFYDEFYAIENIR